MEMRLFLLSSVWSDKVWHSLVLHGMLECSTCFLQFNKQIKQAEGHKPQKVELVISIDAISVVEPKLKVADLWIQ